MSETQEGPVLVSPTPKAFNAIQMVEQELGNFVKQREAASQNADRSVANLHAIDGAIQGTQHLLAKLKAAAAQAEAEVQKEL